MNKQTNNNFSEPVFAYFDYESGKVLQYQGDHGLLALSYVDSDGDDSIKGTVCAPDFDNGLAKRICRQLGEQYQYGQWGRSGGMQQYLVQQ